MLGGFRLPSVSECRCSWKLSSELQLASFNPDAFAQFEKRVILMHMVCKDIFQSLCHMLSELHKTLWILRSEYITFPCSRSLQTTTSITHWFVNQSVKSCFHSGLKTSDVTPTGKCLTFNRELVTSEDYQKEKEGSGNTWAAVRRMSLFTQPVISETQGAACLSL